MTRLFLASIAVVSALAVVPCAVKSQPTPKKGALPKSNQVYVKILLPTDPANRDKDGPVVVDAVVDPFALAMPSHVPFHTVKGFTLSMANQVLSGRMDSVIRTMERNIRLV